MKVKIQNPQPGGFTHVGLKRAERHVKRGIAVWIDPATKQAIRFVESDHRRRAATASAARLGAGGYDRHTHGGPIASDRQMAGVPIVNPRDLIAPRRRLTQRPLFMRAADVNGTR